MTTDEALRIIRECWRPNGDCLGDLERRLTTANPIPLVPFVGAGLSKPMGFPLWSAFLKQLAGECGRQVQVESLLASGQYEEAAEAVEIGLSSEVFHRRVTHIFGKAKSDACLLKGAALVLPRLGIGAIVTTNFDRVLERVFSDAGVKFEHVGWGAKVDSIRQAIGENKPFLLKIHGDGEERTDRVLTKSEYDTHYGSSSSGSTSSGSAAPNSLRAQVERIFTGRTLLFVGCSLAQDRTMQVLLEIEQRVAGQEHFAIIAKPATDAELHDKIRFLGERGIFPIWYPTGRHELVEPLLHWMAELRPSTRGTSAPELVLELPSQRKNDVVSELDLLIPYQQTTPLLGRDRELESLQTWLRSAAPVSIRVLTGGGGAGKTRLALELIESLEKTAPGRWNCGFLTLTEMGRFSGLQNLSNWNRRRPVLAVVDYAAGSAKELRGWLEQLAAAANGGEKLRLLLLEREASQESGWLAAARPHGYSATAVQAMFDPPDPVVLSPLALTMERRDVLRATIAAGAKFRGVTAPEVPSPGESSYFDRKIQEAMWGDPLTLMMAGLTALDTGLVGALAIARPGLALRLAERELDRLSKVAREVPPGLMKHMAAYVTASAGLTRAELRAAAKAERAATGFTHPGGWGALAEDVERALKGKDGARPVEPDVVGEALLLHVWGLEEVAEGCRALVRAAASERMRQVAAAVMRTAQDFCVGAQPRMEPLQWLDALIEQGRRNLELLWVLESEMPQRTLALRERAVVVDQALASALAGLSGESAKPERAAIVSNLGLRLSELGRREEALKASEEAVRIRRQLAAQRPDAFLPDLAMSLSNVGMMLSKLGRREEALKSSEEAVSIYRQVAAQCPDVFLPDLATSVSNVGVRLSELGRREEALKASEEAVRIRRQLTAQRPDAFLPDLAMSLNNAGTMLSELGRREEALKASEEAVAIYRQLTAQGPDAFLPYLALSLGNVGAMLSGLGRRDEALKASEEALGLYRQLAAQRPDAFLPDLALSLSNVGNMLGELGRWEEALKASQEALCIRRQLAVQRPDAFLPDLAASVNNVGNRLGELGRLEEALKANEEAVSIRRQLAEQHPDAFLPDLAASLNNVGAMLSALGRREEALKASEEAAAIYRQLAAQRPDAFLPDLAMSLSNVGMMLSELGRLEEALKASDEAIGIRRQLAEHHPDAFLPDLAMSLGAGGKILMEAGDAVQAVASFREGVECLKPLFLRLPQAFRPLMGALLQDYMQGCEKAGVAVDSALLGEVMVGFQEGAGTG